MASTYTLNKVALPRHVDIRPIPLDPEQTDMHALGSVTIGLELRRLTDAIANKAHTEAETKAAGLEQREGRDDAGWSVHVMSTETGREYLRFDGFVLEPHYHYFTDSDGSYTYEFDEAANDPFIDWVCRCLSGRLNQMFEAAGVDLVVDAATQARIDAMVTDLRAWAIEASVSARAMIGAS